MILVTGGMGFIGVHVVKSLLDAGEDVVVTWNRSWRVPDFWADELDKRVFAERVDVANPYETMAVAAKHKVNGIVYCAAPGVGQGTPTQDFAVNMMGLVNAIEAARVAEVRRFTYLGSSTVYNNLAHGPYREDAPLPIESSNATEAYKKAGETILMHYADRVGLSVASIRPRAVYGPMYYSMVNLPSRLCHAAARGALPDYGRGGVPFAGDVGDFTSVRDVAALTAIVHQAESLKHRVYNMGNGRAVQMQELAEAVMAVAPDARIELQSGENPKGNPSDHYLDLTRVKDEFGYEPQYPIVERGIADYITWLKTHDQ
jgi:nucleoside-diphosphate-sugar epimerase